MQRSPSSGYDVSDYYAHQSGRSVLLLIASPNSSLRVPAPLELQHYGPVSRVLAPRMHADGVRIIQDSLFQSARNAPKRDLLFPFDASSVGEAAAKWLNALGQDEARDGPHTEYLMTETTDNPAYFLTLIDAELMLWESIASLVKPEIASYRVEKLHEALSLGQEILRYIQSKRGYGVGLNALGDIVHRIMVIEKRSDLDALLNALIP